MTEIITAIIIHLVVPLIGIYYFIKIVKRMKVEQLENPSFKELFLIFATYGGLLLVTLTTLFWKWSGMASLGIFYLILIAPIIMGVIAFRNSKKQNESIYHKWIYRVSLLYFLIAPIIIGGLFFVITEYLE
jgi:hypothetical protein